MLIACSLCGGIIENALPIILFSTSTLIAGGGAALTHFWNRHQQSKNGADDDSARTPNADPGQEG